MPRAPTLTALSLAILATLSIPSPTQGNPQQSPQTGNGEEKEVISGIGPLKAYLMSYYGRDWPHYAQWVHSEIKVADDVDAYSIKAIDFGYNILPGVPARGVLVAYASRGRIGLSFVAETGEIFKLCEIPAILPEKKRGRRECRLDRLRLHQERGWCCYNTHSLELWRQIIPVKDRLERI